MKPSDHTHTCFVCGHVWECIDYTLKQCHKKGVFRAVEVNRTGPWCLLHFHLEFARRYAENRGLVLRFTLEKASE